MFVVLLSAILGAFFTPAHSQTIYQPLNLLSWYCPLPVSIASSEFSVADAGVKAERCLVIPTSSNGYQLNGVAASARIDTNNNRYSKAVGGYFSAEVFGRHSGFAEAVGVYARVEPAAKDTWAVALHGECRARTLETGLCMGLNIELRDHAGEDAGTQSKQTMLGINVQPGETQRGVVGMQFQNPQAYSHSIDFAGTFIKIGQVDDTPFCIKFSGRSQLLEFWRGCGNPGATRVGFINMNWGSPDVQLN
jgi:hypothetical protein